jgi:hypothetical protein
MPVPAAVYTISAGDSIQQAVDGAAGGDEIVLNPGIYRENGIHIAGKNLTLRAAAGHNASDTIIDGTFTPPRIITVEDASSLTIRNLTLRNGRALNGSSGSDPFWGDGGDARPGQDGGGISTGGPVTLISSAIAHCRAGKGGLGGDAGFFGGSGDGGDGGSGGAVYAAGPIMAIFSTMTDSSAGPGGDTGRGEGGRAGNGGRGGALYSDSTVTLQSSSITGCRSGSGGSGPVIYRGGAGDGGDGGAIAAAGAVTLTATVITDCAAGTSLEGALQRKGGHGGNGGAVSSGSTVSLTSSSIGSCAAGSGGPGGKSSEGGDGGSGGAVYAAGAVTLTSSAITRCSAGAGGPGTSSQDEGTSGNGGWGGNGGAVYSPGTVSLVLSTIGGCSAGTGGEGSDASGMFGGDGGHGRPGGNGGAVFSSGIVSISSSSITGSRAGTGGHGGSSGWFHTRGRTGASGTGGAAYAQSGTIRFSRLAGNSAVGTAVYSSGGTIEAARNWWGSNSNPSALTGGPVTSSPWLVLGITASPSHITTAQEATIEANLTFDSAGGYHDPSGGNVPFPVPGTLLSRFSRVPDTVPVSWAVTSGYGSVSPASAVMEAGRSRTLFRPAAGSPASVTATADGQAVSAVVYCSDPVALPSVMAVSPSSGPSSGGTAVTISGTGFSGATAVMFGNRQASFSAAGDSMVTATSPGGAAGTVDITVATPYGTSRVVPADRFTYQPPPTTRATTVPTTGPAPQPVPEIAGCWRMAHTVDGTVFAYTYAFEDGGAGWMNGSRTTRGDTDTTSDRIRWAYDHPSRTVTVTEAGSGAGTGRWLLAYVPESGVLDGGGKDGVALVFRRVPCNPAG